MLRTLAFATMLLLALPAYGQDFQTGLDAANRGDYATALREWRPLAEKNRVSVLRWTDRGADGSISEPKR